MSPLQHIFWLVILLNIFGLSPALASDKNVEAKQKKRIIALAPHLVESLYAIGAGDQIIATTSHADYPEAAKNILVVLTI